MTHQKIQDALNELAKMIKAAEHHSPANKQIAKEFKLLKEAIELQLEFVRHRWEVVKHYPGGYADRRDINVTTYHEAVQLAVEFVDGDIHLVRVELYCDGEKVGEV